ncbi:MAG: 6-phosphogluconolactonase [Pseudomonadota bacterium]
MHLIEYPDRDRLMSDLAVRLARELREALEAGGRATLAVPGGTTPGPMFDALAVAELDWESVTVLLTDERRVPADHERSNERLLRERLLVGQAAEARFLRLVPENGDMTAVNDALRAVLPISVLLLGMGADMHTASLFPGSPDLFRAIAPGATPLMAVEASGDLEDRLTLTAPALTGAAATHILITGDDKRAALTRAADLPPEAAPVALVLPRATVHWAA